MASQPAKLNCPNCRKTFVDPNAHSQHIATAHSAKTIECPSCKKKFGTQNALSQHARSCNSTNESPAATQGPAASTAQAPAQAPHDPASKPAKKTKAAKATASEPSHTTENVQSQRTPNRFQGSRPSSSTPSHVAAESSRQTETTDSDAAPSSQADNQHIRIPRNNAASKIAQSIYNDSQSKSRQAQGSTPKKQSGPRETPQKRDPLNRNVSNTPARYNDRVARGRFRYPEYMTPEQARAEVAAGRAWEGVLRPNPNASRMCFFTVPGRTKDVMVKDDWLNRAFAGDTVVISMLNAEDLAAEERWQEEYKLRKRGGRPDSGARNNNNSLKNNSGTPDSTASSMDVDSEGEKSEPKKKLNANVLKGIQSESDVDTETDDDVSVTSDSSDNEAAKTSEAAAKAEEDLAALEAEMSLLNMTTHANFRASEYRGTLEENKPKSDLAKVICIITPFHAEIGYVGRLRRRGDGSFEMRPLAIQHPIFDIPSPDAEYLDYIPMPESKDAKKKDSRRMSKKEKDEKKKKEAENDMLFITYFRRWDSGSRLRPLGTKPEFIGQAGDVEAECRAITSTHMIDTSPHPPSLSAEFGNRRTIEVTDHDLATRKDLRKTARIFTIDPPTARDIDDAMSIEKISENKYRVGVHIADVSHYVTPGSDLDKIAQQRSTSVYMVHTMYPMLPSALSEHLCSLNPKIDRFAFSVMWDLDGEGNILGNEWIGRTIIRSCVKLSYLDAQKCIDAQEAGDLSPALEHLNSLSPEATAEDICGDILNLNTLAQRMRSRRFETGALRLSRLRLHFELGADGYPVDAHPYFIKESNQLIEEFMLLANMSVAKFIYKAFPASALLRSHPAPKDDMLESFGHLMTALNIKFDTTSSGALYKSLMSLEEWQHRPIEELVTKSMNAAIYLSTGEVREELELWHYALNVPFYTHFTSPIRRYPDIVVHRQIQAALDAQHSKPAESAAAAQEELLNIDPCHDSKWVANVCEHSNERKRSARKAQDDSIKLFACLFLKRKPFVDEESIVLDVQKNKLTVFSPHLCLRLRIDIPVHKGYKVRFDEDKRILSVFDESAGGKCILSATYFSKISVTYFTKGAMPMDVGADLSFWFKPPTPFEQKPVPAPNPAAAGTRPSSASAYESSSTPHKGDAPSNKKDTPNKKDGQGKGGKRGGAKASSSAPAPSAPAPTAEEAHDADVEEEKGTPAKRNRGPRHRNNAKKTAPASSSAPSE